MKDTPSQAINTPKHLHLLPKDSNPHVTIPFLTRIIHKPSSSALTPLENGLLNDRLPPRRPLAGNERTKDLDLLDLVLVFFLDDLAARSTDHAGAAASADAAVAATRDTAATNIGVAGGMVAGDEGACGGGAGVGDVEHRAFERRTFALGEDEAGRGVEGCGFIVDG